jgi:hypothetical protein
VATVTFEEATTNPAVEGRVVVHCCRRHMTFPVKPRLAAMVEPVGRAWERVTKPSERWRAVGKRFRIGHRAAFLMGMGGIWVSLGLGILLSKSPENPLLFHTQIPEYVRVAIWCVAGVLAFGFARNHDHQWVGFAALSVPAIERFCSYSFAVILDAIDGSGPPVPWPFLNGTFVYLALLFVVRLVASWPDPPSDEQL